MTSYRPAGFWIRFAALWVDAVLVYAVVGAAVSFFALLKMYVPFEASFVVVAATYSVLAVAWKGRTIGKALCGLTVRSDRDQPIGLLRASLREIVGKLLSGLVLLLGFIWAASSAKKRAWHDHIAGTIVVRNHSANRRGRLVTALVLVVIAVWVGAQGIRFSALKRDLASLAVDPNLVTRYANRDTSTLTEVASLDSNDHDRFVKWLDDNGQDPVDYAVEVAAAHEITIFGELHQIRENMAFLNRLIPELYHRAGVTILAMEAYRDDDNDKLATLITAEHFDSNLALEIARKHCWADWGWTGYWDVMETVWRLNRSLPPEKEKMQLIGIDSTWDGPSIALAGLGDNAADGPVWEKLRLIRLLNADVAQLLSRDEIMTRSVERAIIESKKRGVVWIGANHSFIHYRQPSVANDKLYGEWARMGFILHQKYGDRVFQIQLHGALWGCEMVGAFVEAIAIRRRRARVGFDVEGSPFGLLRDSATSAFRYQPGVCFADLASGYIFLKPLKELRRCRWLEGYVSSEMFVENHPYYEARCGRRLENADEANECLGER